MGKPTIPTEDFDPNIPAHMPAAWLVYSNGRMILRKTRGPALNDFMGGGSTALFELTGGQWVRRAFKPSSPPTICEGCNCTTVVKKQETRYDYQKHLRVPTGKPYDRNTGTWEWVRQGGKIVSPPQAVFCCEQCADEVRHG